MKNILIFGFILSGNLFAQPLQLDMDVFATRRAVFMEKIAPNSVAVFPCRPVHLRNLDNDYQYRHESNFYYLSGFEEPESILLLNPSHPEYKYVMYARKRNRRRETYDGPRTGVESAMATFKADTALFFDDFQNTVRNFIKFDRPIYYTFGINPEIDKIFGNPLIERRSSGNWPVIDPAPILNQMRLIKNEGDWEMGLRKAIDISAKAHIEAIKSIEPGMYEHEIQAVFEYIYRKSGSPRNGYACIVGSGPNSTILHYNVNNRKMQESGYSEEEIKRIRPKVEKYMHIGIRIEDDIVVTKTGYENLSKTVPKEIDEIENLMKNKGLGNLSLTKKH